MLCRHYWHWMLYAGLQCCITRLVYLWKNIQGQQKHRHRQAPRFEVSMSSNAPSKTRLIPFLLLISSNSSREALLKLQPVRSSLSVLSPFSGSFSAITWHNGSNYRSVIIPLVYLDKARHCLISHHRPLEIQFVERRKYPSKLLPSLLVNSVPRVLINQLTQPVFVSL